MNILWESFKKALMVGLPLICVVLGVMFLFRSCGQGKEQNIPPEQQKTIDSLKATKPVFEKSQDSIHQVVVRDTAQAAVFAHEAQVSKKRADEERHRADSLADLAHTAKDSASAWHQAYDARSREAESLRATVASKEAEVQKEKSAFRNLSIAYGDDTTRRVSIEKLNADLLKTINELERPCHLIASIPCPSRTTSAVIAGISGILAGVSVKPKN